MPWLYNRADRWGVFLNQPGEGMIDASGSTLSLSFSCQKQLDMWVIAAPAEETQANAALSVYNSYAHATGLPSPLLEKGAMFWQSRDAYKSQGAETGVQSPIFPTRVPSLSWFRWRL